MIKFTPQTSKIKLLIVLVAILIFMLGAAYLYKKDQEGRVLSETDFVDVNASIYSCILDLTVYPEKRIPATNNWSTILNVQIFDQTNTFMGEVQQTSNNLGQALIDLCAQNIFLSSGTYDFYIKGASHLRMNYDNHAAFQFASSTLDLSAESRLFAGETSIIYDNFINALDLSTQVTRLYTGDYINDLNQDGQVNMLDISNTITNYLLKGDCSPKEVSDGICN